MTKKGFKPDVYTYFVDNENGSSKATGRTEDDPLSSITYVLSDLKKNDHLYNKDEDTITIYLRGHTDTYVKDWRLVYFFKKLVFIGYGRETTLNMVNLFPNNSGDRATYELRFNKMIINGSKLGGNNSIMIKSEVFFHNVLFEKFGRSAYSCFCNTKLRIYYCLKPDISPVFIRSQNFQAEVYFSGGEITSGYGTNQSMWEKEGCSIGDIAMDADYNTVSTLNYLKIGKYSWDLPTTDIINNADLRTDIYIHTIKDSQYVIKPNATNIMFDDGGTIFVTDIEGNIKRMNYTMPPPVISEQTVKENLVTPINDMIDEPSLEEKQKIIRLYRDQELQKIDHFQRILIFEGLTDKEKKELKKYYTELLDFPATFVFPIRPTFMNKLS